MFKQNKYTNIYYQITSRAKGRKKSAGYEYHHIVPDSLGGQKTKDNMVWLTGREHFICHWLLTKMTEGENRAKMIYALNGMKRNNKFQERYNTKITSRVYARLKGIAAQQHSRFMKGRTPPNKGKTITGIALDNVKLAVKNRRKLTPEETARKILKAKETKAAKGKVEVSDETRRKLSNALKGKPKGPMSEEIKAKISKGTKGVAKSKESIAKRKETLKALAASGKHHSQIKIICPHCGIEIQKIIYARWHGKNCKMKT